MEIEPRVELIDYTSNPEKNVALAARLCYSKSGARELEAELTREEIEKLVRKVIDMGHTSTLEHTYFYFHVQCSRVTSHQLVRHRIGTAYSQRSQRYVEEDNFSYIVPPSIEKNEEALELFRRRMKEAQEDYQQLLKLGIPREDARFILPTIETNLMVSYNARSLRHFIRLRSCTRAQWEIRSLAEQMLSAVEEVAPVLFEDAGPPCVTDHICPEGEFSCGRLERELQKHGQD
ncbi:MAG: FAD-dependent thymidylate synthase [Halanaerobiales bacterium]